jgi:hypothetical protein
VRALSLWRAFRQFRRRLDARLGEMTVRITGAEKRLAAAGGKAAELEGSRVRLQDSLACALSLSRAASDALVLVGRVRGFYPRK